MQHSEALFGVPKYGSSLQYPIYEVQPPTDGTDPMEAGCKKITPDPSWASPFILLVNRGECHFTEKVRNAQHAGAVGVIVADDVALSGEPLAYCPDFSQPMFQQGEREFFLLVFSFFFFLFFFFVCVL
jgi:hypothetical protein